MSDHRPEILLLGVIVVSTGIGSLVIMLLVRFLLLLSVLLVSVSLVQRAAVSGVLLARQVVLVG